MTKLIFSHLWHDFKKNIPSIILYVIMYFVIISLISIVFVVNFLESSRLTDDPLFSKIGNSQVTLAQASEFFARNPQVLSAMTAIISAALLFFLWLVLNRMPMRLSKPLYVCPLGQKEKMRYLYCYLFVKIAFSIVLLFALLCLTLDIRRLFISQNAGTLIILLSLWIPLILDLNLKADPGNRKQVLETTPEIATEFTAEMAAHLYWFALLIVESLSFFLMLLMQIKWNTGWFFIWGVIFFSNCVIASRCIPAVFRYILSYETIYLPLTEKESFK